jgi:hypothetical protein
VCAAGIQEVQLTNRSFQKTTLCVFMISDNPALRTRIYEFGYPYSAYSYEFGQPYSAYILIRTTLLCAPAYMNSDNHTLHSYEFGQPYTLRSYEFGQPYTLRIYE